MATPQPGSSSPVMVFEQGAIADHQVGRLLPERDAHQPEAGAHPLLRAGGQRLNPGRSAGRGRALVPLPVAGHRR